MQMNGHDLLILHFFERMYNTTVILYCSETHIISVRESHKLKVKCLVTNFLRWMNLCVGNITERETL